MMDNTDINNTDKNKHNWYDISIKDKNNNIIITVVLIIIKQIK